MATARLCVYPLVGTKSRNGRTIGLPRNLNVDEERPEIGPEADRGGYISCERPLFNNRHEDKAVVRPGTDGISSRGLADRDAVSRAHRILGSQCIGLTLRQGAYQLQPYHLLDETP